MEVLPQNIPTPRLLNHAALDVLASAELPASKAKLSGSRGFGGNGRAIFVGLLLGALAISAAGYLFTRYHSLEIGAEAYRRFIAVRTHKLAETGAAAASGSPLRLQLSPKDLRVTAIALGHPRMAIINGNEVVEGDVVTVKMPGGGVSINLTVVKIGDGKIDLTDGTQIITTRLPQ